MTRRQHRRPLVVVVALAFALALLGIGLTPDATGGPSPTSSVAFLQQPMAVVHPALLPKLTAPALHSHPAAADSPLAVTGTALVLALLALAVARRLGAQPPALTVAARRLPPRRAPPRLPFTR